MQVTDAMSDEGFGFYEKMIHGLHPWHETKDNWRGFCYVLPCFHV